MEVSQRVAEKKLFEKKHKESLPAALLSLRSAMDIYGTGGVELVPAYLLLAEANIGEVTRPLPLPPACISASVCVVHICVAVFVVHICLCVCCTYVYVLYLSVLYMCVCVLYRCVLCISVWLCVLWISV